MIRALRVLLLLAALALGVAAARAQEPVAAPGPFRIELDAPHPDRPPRVVSGWVYNNLEYRVGGMRLKVEGLDAGGQPVSETLGWVYGNVPGGGRAYFSIRVPQAAPRYRVTILGFDRIAREIREGP